MIENKSSYEKLRQDLEKIKNPNAVHSTGDEKEIKEKYGSLKIKYKVSDP